MKRNSWIKRERGRGAGNFEYGRGPKRDNSHRREDEDRRPGSRFFAYTLLDVLRYKRFCQHKKEINMNNIWIGIILLALIRASHDKETKNQTHQLRESSYIEKIIA